MKMKSLSLSILAGISLFTFSCKKDNSSSNTPSNETFITAVKQLSTGLGTTMGTVASSTAESSNISEKSLSAKKISSVHRLSISPCEEIQIDSISTPGSLIWTVDYGNGCTDEAGETRSGHITMKYGSAGEMNSTVSLTITDGNKNTYKQNLTLSGRLNDNGVLAGTLDGTFQSIVDGSIVLGNFKKLLMNECRYPPSGIAELTWGSTTATFDFGDDTCDNKATVIINGTKKTWNLETDAIE